MNSKNSVYDFFYWQLKGCKKLCVCEILYLFLSWKHCDIYKNFCWQPVKWPIFRLATSKVCNYCCCFILFREKSTFYWQYSGLVYFFNRFIYLKFRYCEKAKNFETIKLHILSNIKWKVEDCSIFCGLPSISV